MDRRGFLVVTGSILTGCTRPGLVPSGDPTPDAKTAAIPLRDRTASGPSQPDHDGILTLEEYWYLLAHADQEFGLAYAPVVQKVATTETELRVRMQATGVIRTHHTEQIGLTAILYALYQDDHNGPPLLRGVLLDHNANPSVTYHCKQRWARQYIANRIDGNRLGVKSQSTARAITN